MADDITNDHTGALLEHIDDQLKAIREGQEALSGLPDDVAILEADMSGVQDDIRVMKAAIKDLSTDVKAHGSTIKDLTTEVKADYEVIKDMRTEMKDFSAKMDIGFAGVGESIEILNKHVSARLDDHQRRLARLEQEAA